MTNEEAIKKAIEDFEWAIHADNRSDISLRDMQMAISALREQPRWISVDERLPTDERKVLACYGFDGDGGLGMKFVGTLCYFCFDPEPHWQHASLNVVVTHWMPLPEPPEVEV